MDVVEQTKVQIEFGKYHLPVFKPDTNETAVKSCSRA